MNSYVTSTTPHKDEKRDLWSDKEKLKLDFLWLEITNRCNLECVHCYTNSSPYSELTGSMTLQDWERVILDAKNSGCERAQIIGGEPLVHPDFENILAMCASAFNSVEVFTNATRLNEKYIQYLAYHGANIATSVYATNKDEHDNVTQRSGSFNKTIRNIEMSVECGLDVRVGLIKTDSNQKSKTEDVTEMLLGIGVKHVGVDTVRAVGRGNTQTLKFGDSPETAMCSHCWSGNLCVTYEGKFHPCIMSKHVDLGTATKGIQSALERKVEAHLKAGNTPGKVDGCDPTDCFPNGPSCTPTTCSPA